MKTYFKSPPFFITLGILVFVGVIFLIFKNRFIVDYTNPSNVKIEKKWKLPRVMEEVSGIAYLKGDRMACVQDEDGVIFIYNLVDNKIDRRINFGQRGDYEGIAMVKNTAFVLRSDGHLFEVSDIGVENPKVTEHATPLTKDQNLEGLCYDAKHNRLLLAIKNKEPDDKKFKGVYAFDLASKKLEKEPIYKLQFDNPIFKDLEDVGKPKVFRPSEITIKPKTGEIYMLDAKVPKLLILDKNWETKWMYVLNPNDFPQPEGMVFSPDGRLFISNEGTWNPANILQVDIENQKKKRVKKE